MAGGGGPAAPHPATPDTVFRTLLTAAVRSPAYGSGLHGAYGRLAARHSLAGLTGVPADRPLTEVAEAAGRTTWLRIAPSTSWFSAIVGTSPLPRCARAGRRSRCRPPPAPTEACGRTAAVARSAAGGVRRQAHGRTGHR
ncbi:DUF6183 family protein [Streptomyces sp. YPW6]|uniref:DUF6183 family protein n=1 Tax=Streptomyces sp. YPW6 TaxID=2840373 RepID=UPI003D75CAEC